MMKSKNLLKTLSLFYILLLGSTVSSNAQNCDFDTIEPTALCNTGLAVSANAENGVLIWGQDVDAGSYDDCGAVTLRLTTAENDNGSVPEQGAVTLPPEIGFYELVLYVVDQAGNWSNCFLALEITDLDGPNCMDDTEAPVLNCSFLELTMPENEPYLTVYANQFITSVSDNCDGNLEFYVNHYTGDDALPPGSYDAMIIDSPGVQTIGIWVYDNSGNLAFCQTDIIVHPPVPTNCDTDVVPPVPICVNGITASTHPIDGVTLWALDFDAGSYDLCSEVELRIVLAENSTGTLPATTSLNFPPELGTYDVEIWAVDESENTDYCSTYLLIDRFYHTISGQVYIDNNGNCTLDQEEEDTGLGGWPVQVTNLSTGATILHHTQANGSYEIAYSSSQATVGNIQVEVLLPDGISTGCPSSVIIDDILTAETVVNFPVSLIEDCEYLTVDVSVPFLRRCFENQIFVNYTNYSNFPIDNAVITVQLDPYLNFLDASVPYTDLGNGFYEFEIGTIPAASFGQLLINILLDCESALGATHCVEATIEPFSCDPSGNFAELTISGECDTETDQVNFTITNTGTSSMANTQQVRIVEDVIMYMNENPIQLGAGEDESFSFPANGATWRLEIPQDSSFPYGGIAAAFVEGCGGFSPGIATQFLLENPNPNIDKICLENIGSWDPNDKQALPRGYGEQHFIEANTPLEYLIRFQNTGTDTAFNVRIEDQISTFLDPASLIPGAASHPYRMELKEDGMLLFHFDNIMLPDSNINLEGSNGFVQFTIQQLPDNPIGTLIENTAEIYFDFNEAVITNTVQHTIGEDFVLVRSHEVLVPGLALNIAPNPLQTTALLKLSGLDLKAGQCMIYNSHGQLNSQLPLLGNELQLQRSDFGQAGLYFFRIIEDNKVLAQGKIMVH